MRLMIRAHDLGVRGEENIARMLSELDLDGVQLVAYKSIEGVPYLVGGLTAQRARSISDALSSAGKEIAMIGAYFNPVHPNGEKAGLGKDVFRDYLSLSAYLGCPFVGSETGSYMGDPWGYHSDNRTKEAQNRVVAVFRELAEYADGFGACVAIEGAYNHVCYSPDALRDVVERIGRRNVKVVFDLYNYLSLSNYSDAYGILKRGHELFGSDILLYHVKDFCLVDGKLAQCGVGRGVLDFERILGEIYAVNPDALLVLEGTVGDDIPYAVAHLRAIMNQLSAK